LIRDEFVRTLASGFGTGLYQVDFGAKANSAREAINGWVSERTDGLINGLLQFGDITEQTVLTLVNAIHLTAPWMTPFRRTEDTTQFATAAGSTVPVTLMRNTGYYQHGAGDRWTWLTVPYRGGRIAMTVIVPDAGGFDDVRANIGPVLAEVTVRAGQGGSVVALSMPRSGPGPGCRSGTSCGWPVCQTCSTLPWPISPKSRAHQGISLPVRLSTRP
jgi:serpin B